MFEFGEKVGIFKTIEDEQSFQKDGYVRKNFLRTEDVSGLFDIYKKLHPNGVEGFYTTTYNPDAKHRAEVQEAILKVVQPRIEEVFKDYKIFFASFIIKNPGPTSELNLHQDMTLVDESKFSGVNIWCPLISLDARNGAIEVLPGSHQLFPTYRGATVPSIYQDTSREIRKYTKPMYLKKGEGIIFDQSIIHYSPPNLSDVPRPVINIFVAHKDAKIIICYYDREKEPHKVELFEEEDDFLCNFQQFGADIFSRPGIGKSMGFRAYNFPKLTIEKLRQLYGESEMGTDRVEMAPKERRLIAAVRNLFRRR
jgi:hypothetical protein